jgi:hypothetical protein
MENKEANNSAKLSMNLGVIFNGLMRKVRLAIYYLFSTFNYGKTVIKNERHIKALWHNNSRITLYL